MRKATLAARVLRSVRPRRHRYRHRRRYRHRTEPSIFSQRVASRPIRCPPADAANFFSPRFSPLLSHFIRFFFLFYAVKASLRKSCRKDDERRRVKRSRR